MGLHGTPGIPPTPTLAPAQTGRTLGVAARHHAFNHLSNTVGRLKNHSHPPVRQNPFTRFTRYVSPNPIPGKWQFYWEEIRHLLSGDSYTGSQRYLQTLKKDRRARLKFLTLTSLSAIGFTMFRRLQRTTGLILALSLMTSTVMDNLKTLPKLPQAYEHVQRGNPTRGRRLFQEAMKDSLYSIFQDFMKPLAIGGSIAMLLSVPGALRGEGSTLFHRWVRDLGKLTRVNRNWPPLVKLHQGVSKITQPGDRLANRIRQKIPALNWLEH